MEYGKIIGFDKPVSKIVYGCMNGKMMNGKDNDEVLNAAFEAGINTFDNARVYGFGKSEKSLGKWLKTIPRSDAVVITKCCHPSLPFRLPRMSRKHARSDIFKSLECLATDYVDILMLHRDNPAVPVSEIMDFMDELVKEGYVHALGASNWSYERIIEANNYASVNGKTPFILSSPNYCLTELVNDIWKNCVSLSGNAKNERQLYIDSQMPVFCWSSLALGFLSGKYASNSDFKTLPRDTKKMYLSKDNIERLSRAEKLAKELGVTVPTIALAYILSSGLNTFPIVSFSSVSRISSTLKALEIKLTKEQCDWLNLG